MIICGDIGGTNSRIVVLNSNLKIEKIIRFNTYQFKYIESYEKKLFSEIGNIINNYNVKSGILGIPGSISKDNKTVLFAPNVKWENWEIGLKLEKKFNIPFYIYNDANLAGLGEYGYGNLKGVKNGMYITIGTGIGGAIFINGKLYKGNTGIGAEIGHMIIKFNGRKCNCGKKGCFETYASVSGFIITAINILKKNNINPLEIAKNIKDLPKKILNNLDNDVYMDIFRTYMKHLMYGLGSLVEIFEPERIVLSGGLMYSGDKILPFLKDNIHKYISKGLKEKTSFFISKLLDNAGFMGAAYITNNLDTKKT